MADVIPKMFPNKSLKLRNLFLFSLLVAFLTMAFDLIFHATQTFPMETPAYFVAKFGNSFLVSLFTFSIPFIILGALVGAVAFDVLVGFYYAVAYYTQNPALSCCFVNAPTVIGVPQVTYAVIGYYPITSNVLVFVGVHFAVYFMAYVLVRMFMVIKR